MAPAKGNRFWLKRSSHGRKPIFASPEELLDSAYEYFEWCYQNPLIEMKAFASGGEVVQEAIPKQRAFTLGGLCIFLDISQQTFLNYRNDNDFLEVTKQIEEIIRDQKFTGAASGFFNANIIARDLGLKDASETKITHSFEDMSDDDLDRELNSLKAKG